MASLSPTLFNIYTSDLPPLSAPVQVMAYADDITITSTHTSTSAAKKYIQPYLHKVFFLDKTKQPLTKSRQNNLHSVHTRPCRIYEKSEPNNKQQSSTQLRTNKSYIHKSMPNHIHHHYVPSVTHTSLLLHPHTHHIVTPGFMDRPCWSDCTAGQMDGESGW